MLNTPRVYGGAVVAPHHLASQAGLSVLADGGNAIEAMIAAASTIAVVYPHMNALGGDNFWLVHAPGEEIVAIDACGAAAGLATIDFFRERGHAETIPSRGPLAALTVGGAVSGWRRAFEHSRGACGGRLPLARLLEDAIRHATDGVAVSGTLAENARAKRVELEGVAGFTDTYFVDGEPPARGARLRQPRLAATLEHLARVGLDDFYRGELARGLAAELEAAGSPLRLDDLERHRALDVAPLALEVAGHTVYNLPPPTQGLASLLLLGVLDRLEFGAPDTVDWVHAIVEASKCAFRVRDRHVTDPDYMERTAESFLDAETLDALAARVDPARAAPWPDANPAGDTVWLGAIDREGRAVSFIQSVYWEFGSGLVLPSSGVLWQNRGTSFSLDPDHHNALAPHRRPFHTIQPALARLADGRTMAYGTMGGEGQPQTQAMLFARHVLAGEPLQRAVTAPRWLLGRTWGSESTSLRIESRFEPALLDALEARGHAVERVGPFEEVMGHAGALVHYPDGLIEGAADPRGDGSVAAR